MVNSKSIGKNVRCLLSVDLIIYFKLGVKHGGETWGWGRKSGGKGGKMIWNGGKT